MIALELDELMVALDEAQRDDLLAIRLHRFFRQHRRLQEHEALGLVLLLQAFGNFSAHFPVRVFQCLCAGYMFQFGN